MKHTKESRYGLLKVTDMMIYNMYVSSELSAKIKYTTQSCK